jgi:hypothetical protein
MSLDDHKSCVLRIHFLGNDDININENHIIFNNVRAYAMGLDKKLSQLMDCPLPTSNIHIIMSTNLAHT